MPQKQNKRRSLHTSGKYAANAPKRPSVNEKLQRPERKRRAQEKSKAEELQKKMQENREAQSRLDREARDKRRRSIANKDASSLAG